MVNAVRSLAETYSGKKLIVVLGSMLELGDESEKLHFHVGSEIGRFPLERIFLFGPETQAIRDGAIASGYPGAKINLEATHEALAEKIRPLINPETAILFKGSRGMALERVIQALLQMTTSKGA
jgi:UDP-N-acetylmuramyl pentapeptide synthase